MMVGDSKDVICVHDASFAESKFVDQGIHDILQTNLNQREVSTVQGIPLLYHLPHPQGEITVRFHHGSYHDLERYQIGGQQPHNDELVE
jgi:hypothetical protein